MIEWPEFAARLSVLHEKPRDHVEWAGWASKYRAEILFPTLSGLKKTVRSIGRLDVALRATKQILHEVVRPRASVHGYVRGRSTVSAAQPHAGSPLVLAVDLKGFFGQIDYERVRETMESRFDNAACSWIRGACFVEGSLPLGYRTSPALSNIAFEPTDAKIESLANDWGLAYTRWVDDLSFSGARLGDDFLATLQNLLANDGWVVNDRKTRFMRRSPYVLGLYVGRDVDRPRLPRRLKDRLLVESFYFARHGLGHFDRAGVLPPMSLFGYVSYAASVEPEFAAKVAERVAVGVSKSGGKLF